jgi:hypothetical protein
MANGDGIGFSIRVSQPVSSLLAFAIVASVVVAFFASLAFIFRTIGEQPLGGFFVNNWAVISAILGVVSGAGAVAWKTAMSRLPDPNLIATINDNLETLNSTLTRTSDRVEQLYHIREDIAYLYGRVGEALPHQYGSKENYHG